MDFSNGVGAGIGRQNQSFEDDDNGNGKKKSLDSTEGKRRGRPLGSKNRPKLAEDFEGSRPIPLILSRGCNLIHCLHQFSISNHAVIFISTARGLVSHVKIQPTSHQQEGLVQPPMNLEGIFELTELCGALMPSIWNLPLKATLEGPQGQVIKGDIFGDNLSAAGPVTIIVSRLANPVCFANHFSQHGNGNGIGSSSSNGTGQGIMISSSNWAQYIQNNGFSSTPSLLPPPAAAPSQTNVHPCNGIDSNLLSSYTSNQNNGFSPAISTPSPLLPPPSSSQANVHMNEYPSSHHTARMNNHYPSPGLVPDFSNSPFDSQDVSTFASWPDPADGAHYSVP